MPSSTIPWNQGVSAAVEMKAQELMSRIRHTAANEEAYATAMRKLCYLLLCADKVEGAEPPVSSEPCRHIGKVYKGNTLMCGRNDLHAGMHACGGYVWGADGVAAHESTVSPDWGTRVVPIGVHVDARGCSNPELVRACVESAKASQNRRPLSPKEFLDSMPHATLGGAVDPSKTYTVGE